MWYVIFCILMYVYFCCIGYGREFKDNDDLGLFNSNSFEDEGVYFWGMLLEKVIEMLLVWLLIGLIYV